jgi:hypothetical protein
MKHLYGEFEENQFEEYKKQLHKKLFWLLIYKDPNTKDQFPMVDDVVFENYFYSVMAEINSLNSLLFYPVELCSIVVLLQEALMETQKDDFNYKAYRKLVLDAHGLVDKIKEV